MRSRVLVGVGAWLLGAVSATVGSLYAVDQLGQGLLEQHSTQESVARVNAELAAENSERATPMPASSPAARLSPNAPGSAPQAKRVAKHPTARPGPGNSGQLLRSPDGTAMAVCEQGGARLDYWIPAQGFEAFDVVRGPLPTASVTFKNSSGGVVMKVTCSGSGTPVEHLSSLNWGGGTRHEE